MSRRQIAVLVLIIIAGVGMGALLFGVYLGWFEPVTAVVSIAITLVIGALCLAGYFIIKRLQESSKIQASIPIEYDMKQAQTQLVSQIEEEYHEHLEIRDSQTRNKGTLYIIDGKGLVDGDRFVGIISSKDLKKTQILLNPNGSAIEAAIQGAVNPLYARSMNIRRIRDKESGKEIDTVEETILPELELKEDDENKTDAL